MTTSPSTHWFRRVLNACASVIIALWLLFEEWIWDRLLALMRALAKLPPIAWLEARVAQLPPYAALLLFAIPALVLLPFKLAAFWLIAHGKKSLGVLVFITAKVIGTALLARIYALTQTQLMSIAWFSAIMTRFLAWKTRLYMFLRALPLVVATRERIAQWKAGVKAW